MKTQRVDTKDYELRFLMNGLNIATLKNMSSIYVDNKN